MRRRELLKGVALALIIVGTFGAAMAWAIPGVGLLARLLWTGAVVGGFALFVAVHFTRDRAPDFLHEHFGAYLERDGFCFVVVADHTGEQGVLRLHFQSRYDAPSEATVAFRPRRRLFRRAHSEALPTVRFHVLCPPGGYGVVHMPVAFDPEAAGATVELEVGTSVRYPEGRGTTLRFREATVLRANEQFTDWLATVGAATELATGGIPWHTPTTTTIAVPETTRAPPKDARATTEIRWQVGDAAP